jgi:hypothetical protein
MRRVEQQDGAASGLHPALRAGIVTSWLKFASVVAVYTPSQ